MFAHAFTLAGLIAQAGALLIVAAAVSRRMRSIRFGLVGAGALWAAAAVLAGSPVAAAWSILLASVNAIHLLVQWLADRQVVLTAEETGLHDRAFFAMGRADVRHLIDQGLWLDGQPDEVLTREGQPVSHLFFLAEGGARVLSSGTPVGHVEAGSFIGEATALSGEPATGTVVLTRPSRFWCVAADTLRGYLRENPEIGSSVQGSLARSLKEKLAASNRTISGAGGV